ncbi:collagen alpha-1(IX) chain-like isoform X1 [Thunnus maccoyii]|uniref:collagen alpha-1(IX) chain-like isoform X1 n=1 Tax=Thunnus maccoyii TaxID=8240 RepID=UPI001C4ABA6F|nr:collagen alpha-1(IX) chain-like isoform X1 [Thunnus maccoyii]
MGGVKRNILLYSLCCCYVIPQYLCTGLHSQTVRFSSQVGIHMEQQSMCPQINVGEDRFPGFYIVSQFHIAELARRGTVKKVAGSSPQHVAYQIGPAFNFRINTRSAYPLGLPEEFAFVSVLRMSGSTITKHWNIWQMQDVNGDEQLSVRLNGESESLEFTFTAADTGRQTVVFSSLPFLFNEQWHRVLLDVNRLSVTLFVDCVMIGSQNISPRQKISLDGFTLIGKLKDNPVIAVPVRLLTPSSHLLQPKQDLCIFF